MPRYVVERTFPEELNIPVDSQGAATCLAVVDRNADEGVTWVHSTSATTRGRRSASMTLRSPEAIRKTADATRCRSTRSHR